MARVAVVLSGCGVFDGSEIHEAVGVLYHLSRNGVAYQCFAPDVDQMHVVNHATGQVDEGATRSVLVESARIARGEITPLSELKAGDFDAVFFPGGFGAAKNLCTFATQGAGCDVESDVARVLNDFRDAGKPIGLCCIAPVLAAKALPGCAVTIGNDPGTAEAIRSMGSEHVEKPVTAAHTDEAHRVVTAPAYMYGEAPIHEVIEGIGEMVASTLALVGSGARA